MTSHLFHPQRLPLNFITGRAGEYLNHLDIVYPNSLPHIFNKKKVNYANLPFIVDSDRNSYPGEMIQIIQIQPGTEHYAKTRSDPQLHETMISTGDGYLTKVHYNSTSGAIVDRGNDYGPEISIKVQYLGNGEWVSLEYQKVRDDAQICSICQYFAIRFGLVELKIDEYKLIL